MFNRAIKKYVTDKLLSADIAIDGSRPWDIQVHDDRFYPKVAYEGSLGLGEAYMDGWFDAKNLDETIKRLLQSDLGNSYTPFWERALHFLGSTLFNKQSKERALEVGKRHYDVSNELFQKMLGKRMSYSCAYWKDAKNLDEAQEAKLDLVCRKLGLKPGMKVLDIGCGWGSFTKFAAEKYQVNVVGITISHEQLNLAQELCKDLPVDLRFQDYRDVNETFDRIVSIGQMEHVGPKNYRTYMEMADRCLKNDGLFLLHTIGTTYDLPYCDPWIEKYIFPNGVIPNGIQLLEASKDLFIMEDWHNFGADYDKTLMAWHENFVKSWPSIKTGYTERFYRMWNFYLLTCAGAFRARQLQLWQLVFSKKGVPGGYLSLR
jgi:cyclopropane-fatty-acyl-phospholipid synthase